MPVHSLRTHTLAPRSTPVLRSLRFRSEISHIRVNLCSSVVSEVGKIANPQSETGNEKSVAPQRFSQAGRRLIAVACKLRSRPHERRAGRRNGRMTRQPPAGRVAQPASSHSPARAKEEPAKESRCSGGLRHALLACCGCWQSGSSCSRSWCGWRVAPCLPPVRRSCSRCGGSSVVGVCVCGCRCRAVSACVGCVRACLVSRCLSGGIVSPNEIQSHPCEFVSIRGLNLKVRYLCCLLLKTQ